MSTSTTGEITERLARLLRQHSCGALYVNGPYGVGFSHLLADVAVTEWQARGLSILGPFALAAVHAESLKEALWGELLAKSYVSDSLSAKHMSSHKALWEAFRNAGNCEASYTFLVLVELLDGLLAPPEAIGDLFSDIRYFEGVWRHSNIRVVYVIAGSWLHQEIEEYCRSIEVSFPYSRGLTNVQWSAADPSKITGLTQRYLGPQATQLISDALCEISGGNMAVAEAILAVLPRQPFSLELLWNTSCKVAASSVVCSELLRSWERLPSKAENLLKRLLVTRCVSVFQTNNRVSGPLLNLGIAKEVTANSQSYLRFFSPFVELCIRSNLAKLGITDLVLPRIRMDDFIPELDLLCHQGYELIREIENLLRSYIMLQVQVGQRVEPTKLIGYDKAKEGQDEDCRNGLLTPLNPLISYYSTRDLAYMVTQTSVDRNGDAWRDIAEAIRKLVPVRNAIMHNRVVGFDELDRLQQLRGQIYAAISESNMP